MSNSSEKVRNLVQRRLGLLAIELGRPQLAEASSDVHLLGGQSPLDSIGLVTLIADLEGDIQKEFGKTVILADEKAMSLTLSPFRKVGTLIDYIEAKLEE
jgi:acyl carrier protein